MKREILEKALKGLENKGLDGKIENSTLYICVGDTELELSEFEIKYQAGLFD